MNNISRYTRKSERVEAYQFDGRFESAVSMFDHPRLISVARYVPNELTVVLRTPDACGGVEEFRIKIGDWIVRSTDYTPGSSLTTVAIKSDKEFRTEYEPEPQYRECKP